MTAQALLQTSAVWVSITPTVLGLHLFGIRLTSFARGSTKKRRGCAEAGTAAHVGSIPYGSCHPENHNEVFRGMIGWLFSGATDRDCVWILRTAFSIRNKAVPIQIQMETHLQAIRWQVIQRGKDEALVDVSWEAKGLLSSTWLQKA